MTPRNTPSTSKTRSRSLLALGFSFACSSGTAGSLETSGGAGTPDSGIQGGGLSGGGAGGQVTQPSTGGVAGNLETSRGGQSASGSSSGGATAAGGQRSKGSSGGVAGNPQGGQTPTGGTSSAPFGGTGGAFGGQGGKSPVGGASSDAGRSSAGGGAGSGGMASVATGGTDRPGWTLVFSDEFNGPSGSAVDAANWNLVNRGDGFGNNELQFYTNRTANAATDGQGSLVIKAIKEPYMGREYTSARLESNGKVELTYGRIEGRLKLPFGQGIWPAFWMLGSDIGSAGWPTCGEIDVMENIGREPSITHGTLHGPGYSGGNPLGAAYTLPSGRFADAFHVFAVEWEKDVVRFYVDDNLFKTRTPADLPAGSRWVYDHPFYLLLNVAVGGTWPGSPDATTTFPQTLLVDYVRVYRR